MAIRGPGGPPRPEPATTSPIREQATSPLQRLVDFGMARTPAEASKVLREIIALLAGAGFPVPKLGSPEQQLQTALKAFQQKEGLPVTGRLDEATKGALEQAGLLPGRADTVVDSSTGRPAAKDGVDGAPRPGFDFGVPRFGGGGGDGAPTSGVPVQKGRQVEAEAAAARVEHSRPDVEVDLRAMLGALREAGFAGAGKGKEQLTDAVKKLQRVDGLPVTGKLDAATATALEKRGVLDAATAQALREQDPSWAPPAASTSSNSAATTPSSSEPSAPTTNAESRGAGSGDVAGTAGGRGSEGGAGVGGEAGATGTTSHGDVDGRSDDIGNGYAGDLDDDDAHRGRANRDDDADDDFAHWEVPRLALQIDTAFDAVVRDDDGRGAATYGWQVVLHRPGIYAARQPAEEVLKLVVSHAGPFDPVWQQAIDALNARLALFDPTAPAVDPARLRLALQRARYR